MSCHAWPSRKGFSFDQQSRRFAPYPDAFLPRKLRENRVLGGRDDATCRRPLDKVGVSGKTFVTDDWEGCHRLLPENQLLTGKDLTFPIEQDNSNVRHYLARFRRKTKVVSKCPTMVDLSPRLLNHLLEAVMDPLPAFDRPMLAHNCFQDISETECIRDRIGSQIDGGSRTNFLSSVSRDHKLPKD